MKFRIDSSRYGKADVLKGYPFLLEWDYSIEDGTIDIPDLEHLMRFMDQAGDSIIIHHGMDKDYNNDIAAIRTIEIYDDYRE